MFNIHFYGAHPVKTNTENAEDALRCGKSISRRTGRKMTCVQNPLTGEAFSLSKRAGEFLYKSQEAWE